MFSHTLFNPDLYEIKAPAHDHYGPMRYSSVHVSFVLCFSSQQNNLCRFGKTAEWVKGYGKNVQNLAVYEIYGHKIRHYDKAVGKHKFAYQLQMSHPTFKNTTPVYQRNIQSGFRLAGGQ